MAEAELSTLQEILAGIRGVGKGIKVISKPIVTTAKLTKKATDIATLGTTGVAAKAAATNIQNISKIVSALDKQDLPIDEANPFRYAGRKKYKNGAVYIDARTNKIVRYDKGQNTFTDISDQVDLSEIM